VKSVEFSEAEYLAIHEDVRQAVANGTFASGYDHYLRYGRVECRALFKRSENRHFIEDYSRLVQNLIAIHPGNMDLAMAKAVGSLSTEEYARQGDQHVAVLRMTGLTDYMQIFDIGCGSGRTAQALLRHGWVGQYTGTDVIPELVRYAKSKLPDWRFGLQNGFRLDAETESLDLVYAWSLFTHLTIEETYLYLRDAARALKAGGTMIFSVLELSNPDHYKLFKRDAELVEKNVQSVHLNAFTDRQTVSIFAKDLGFEVTRWVDADDRTMTPSLGCFGQSIAILRKM
jgi:ubiquinone/menaquinone biosynthesis C-methylase UbiE